ncbi:MAG: hypothetical protein ABIR47_17800 [Candidatus Kapaibacterium sp.]
MTNEEFQELIERLRPVGEQLHSVQITEEEIATLTREQAEQIVALYGSNSLITLPQKERTFFEWLKERDEPIWSDLWGDDEIPYRVGLGFLPDLLPNKRGFPVCDLIEHENYYFTTNEIAPEDGSPFLDAALGIVKNEGRLSMDQAFVVEVWRAPIDLWRFAYIYKQPIDEVKNMVRWLLEEGILRQPTQELEEEPGSEAQ